MNPNPELESSSIAMSVSDRATPASRPIDSLPPGFDYDDEGEAEAIRRDAEMDADPSACLSMEELKRAVGR